MSMNISARIKSLLALKGKRSADLAAYMGIRPQGLQSKYARGSFSSDDLIKIAEFTGVELAFVSGNDKIILDSSCIRESNEQE